MLAVSSLAEAHTKSLSYSSWRLGGSGSVGGANDSVVEARARIPRLELTRLGPIGHQPPTSPVIGELLASSLELSRDGEPCRRARDPLPRTAPDGWAVHGWQVACAGDLSDEFTLTTRLMLETAPSHLHFARVELPDGRVVERVLSSGEPSWSFAGSMDVVSDSSAAGTSFAQYVVIGIEHIVTGWDHLAFLLALLLLANRIGEVARLVTGFTIAHSVTLALAVLGWVHPQASAVEAVIGFSVFLVAAENAWLLGTRDQRVPWWVVGGLGVMGVLALAGLGALSWVALAGLALFTHCHFGILRRAMRPDRWRAALAFAFGLLHGFGFAGILAEMQLPTTRLVPALLGFNIGVELGQLLLVAAAWPLLRAASRTPGIGATALPQIASAAIAGVGLFWFITRTFGG